MADACFFYSLNSLFYGQYKFRFLDSTGSTYVLIGSTFFLHLSARGQLSSTMIRGDYFLSFVVAVRVGNFQFSHFSDAAANADKNTSVVSVVGQSALFISFILAAVVGFRSAPLLFK
jgi:hypothetical protein